MSTTAKPIQFPGRIGLGTWRMGERREARNRELAAVAHALAVGYRLIDTAEMYGDGGAERVVGRALEAFGRARRPQLFIVSKVLPENASRAGVVRACEATIRRIGCEYLDLYLLHWRGEHPLTETLRGFGELLKRGLIRRFGVSNFDVGDLEEWCDAEKSVGLAATAQCNQVLYCVASRAIEFDLLPWQRRRGIWTMAYSPLQCGELARDRTLTRLAQARGVTASHIALAWCVRHPDVVAIPKSIDPGRLEQNLAAANLALTSSELAAIDAAFPPPARKRPLAMA